MPTKRRRVLHAYRALESLVRPLRRIFDARSDVAVAILFGSLTGRAADWQSDIDIGILSHEPLTSSDRRELIEQIAMIVGRAVDLVDLRTANPTLLREILTTGELVYCPDRSLYAALITKLVFDAEDWAPYRDRILAGRRHSWIAR